MTSGAEPPVAPPCPRCGGGTVPLIWGYPNEEDFTAQERGEVHLGGCIVPAQEPWPQWSCTSCGAQLMSGDVSPTR